MRMNEPTVTYLPPLDPGYNAVWLEWQRGKLTYDRIFQIVSSTIVANDLGQDLVSFQKKIRIPPKLTYQDVYQLSRLFSIPFPNFSYIIGLAVEDDVKKWGGWGI